MRCTNLMTTLALVLAGVAIPGRALAGEASFDGQPWSGALAASIADAAGDTLIAARGCRGPGALEPVDGCGVLVVGDGETRSAIMIAEASCAAGPGCYAGHPVIARADGFEPAVSDTELDLFVRIHGGIATSPLGLAHADTLAPATEVYVKVYTGIVGSPVGFNGGVVDARSLVRVCGGLGSSPVGFIIANPDQELLTLGLSDAQGGPFDAADLGDQMGEIVAQQVCGGLGSCPLGIADLPRAFVTANAWLGSLASP
jgi:hypothetical protein